MENKEFHLNIANYYGTLKVEKSGTAYYLALRNYDGTDKVEISEDLARKLCEEIPHDRYEESSIFGDD